MKVSYGPLWKTLLDKKMTKLELREVANLSKGTSTKMGKNESVGLEIVLRIAAALDTREISDYCRAGGRIKREEQFTPVLWLGTDPQAG